MLSILQQLDRTLFLFLNGLHHPVLDDAMWWISDKYCWIPFYLLLLFFVWRYDKRRWWVVLLFLAGGVVLSDQLSGFVKDGVARLRPSRNPELDGLVHTLRGYRGGRYGFVSSHAANAFMLAAFFVTRYKQYTIHWWWMVVWAAMVAYSRIYLGVHYPGDILGGALIGAVTGWLMARWSMRCSGNGECVG